MFRRIRFVLFTVAVLLGAVAPLVRTTLVAAYPVLKTQACKPPPVANNGADFQDTGFVDAKGACIPNGCPGNGNYPNFPKDKPDPFAATNNQTPDLTKDNQVNWLIVCPNIPDVGTHWTCPTDFYIPTLVTVWCAFPAGSTVSYVKDPNCLADPTKKCAANLPQCPASAPKCVLVNNGNTYPTCRTLTDCDIITKFVDPAINFLAALVGIAVTISIIIGGIQTSAAGGDPGKVAAGRARIRSSLIALATFIFLWLLINFLIPGGLL